MRASHVGAALLGLSLVGAGALTFSAPRAVAATFSGGTFGGRDQTGSATDIQTALLGQPLSVKYLVVSSTDPNTSVTDETSAGVRLNNGARIYFGGNTASVSPQAWIRLNINANYLETGLPLMFPAGAYTVTDAVTTRQATVPFKVDATHGTQFTIQATLDTCGSSLGGAQVDYNAGDGTTRDCKCWLTSAAWSWVNRRCNATGTSTSCPSCP